MKALITAGIGDFIALESVLRPGERPGMLYYATRAEDAIRELAPHCFPRLKGQVSLYRDFTGPFTKRFCFDSKEQLLQYVRLDFDPAILVDLSIGRVGQEYLAGKRSFVGSSLLRKPLADVSRFALPERYCVVHPYSANARTPLRDLTSQEWQYALLFLRDQDLTGVVLNRGGSEAAPRDGRLLDLSNKTTLLEALEITKGATAYFGSSSCFSVLAAQVVEPDLCHVKGHDQLRDKWQAFYYPKAIGCVHVAL